jgi:transposase InsO family protein
MLSATTAKTEPNEKRRAIAFPKAALAYYKSLGVKVEAVMTDNGSCYCCKAFNKVCQVLGLRHIFTKPYTPKTDRKAGRFIQTALREWAYGIAYENSQKRKTKLSTWVHRRHIRTLLKSRSAPRAQSRGLAEWRRIL